MELPPQRRSPSLTARWNIGPRSGRQRDTANPLALDLIDKMLQFNPNKRITVEEALSHPYMASLHEPNDEPCCPQPFYFPLDDNHLNGCNIRDLIFEDIMVRVTRNFLAMFIFLTSLSFPFLILHSLADASPRTLPVNWSS